MFHVQSATCQKFQPQMCRATGNWALRLGSKSGAARRNRDKTWQGRAAWRISTPTTFTSTSWSFVVHLVWMLTSKNLSLKFTVCVSCYNINASVLYLLQWRLQVDNKQFTWILDRETLKLEASPVQGACDILCKLPKSEPQQKARRGVKTWCWSKI